MIRSSLLTASALGALLALAACDGAPAEEELGKLASKEECVAKFGAEECERIEQEHYKTAENFTSVQSCEERFGANACTTRQQDDGSSIIVPALVGFMLGNMMSRPQPVYYDRDRSLYSGRSYVGSYNSTKGSAPRILATPKTPANLRPSASQGGVRLTPSAPSSAPVQLSKPPTDTAPNRTTGSGVPAIRLGKPVTLDKPAAPPRATAPTRTFNSGSSRGTSRR